MAVPNFHKCPLQALRSPKLRQTAWPKLQESGTIRQLGLARNLCGWGNNLPNPEVRRNGACNEPGHAGCVRRTTFLLTLSTAAEHSTTDIDSTQRLQSLQLHGEAAGAVAVAAERPSAEEEATAFK